MRTHVYDVKLEVVLHCLEHLANVEAAWTPL
jgi:hypothetical protein